VKFKWLRELAVLYSLQAYAIAKFISEENRDKKAVKPVPIHKVTSHSESGDKSGDKLREMNRKRKGTRNEHRSMRMLEAAGYRCTRSGASLGVFDIIGVGSTDVVLVQVKTRDWPGALETEAMREFPAPANARKLMHRWRARQRLPDVREL
jgi:hypothetical protein